MARSRTSFKPGCTPGPGRRKGAISAKTVEVRELARKLIEDPEYVAGLARRLNAGEAGAMEPLLWAYAHGRPRDRSELPDRPPIAFVTMHPIGHFDPLAAESEQRRSRLRGGNGAVPRLVVPAQDDGGNAEPDLTDDGETERAL